MDPKIYLGIDNCSSSKRWVRPEDWMRLIHSLGLKYVEASADTECDPLYLGSEYIETWRQQVKAQRDQWDICVKNVFSGHGTYATCGIAHPDANARRHFTDLWVKAQMDIARSMDAGFGFFAHGFEEPLLQDAEAYEAKLNELYDTLADLASYGKKIGLRYIGLEQMYSPHQPPWTLKGTYRLLKEVYARAGAPLYVTLDLGHMNGQQYFPLPDEAKVREIISKMKSGNCRRAWVGTACAYELCEKAARGEMPEDECVQAVLADVAAHPNLFALPQDHDSYAWLETFGRYSPILHLQQTDGFSSPHWPFTKECNEKGFFRAEPVLKALKAAFAKEDDPSLPPPADEIVLTLEMFIATAGNTFDLIHDLRDSIAYWRQWIPRDGMRLSEIEV